MSSEIEKNLQQAKKQLDEQIKSGELEVNRPEQSIVKKAVSSIDEDMEHPEVDDEDRELEEEIEQLPGKGPEKDGEQSRDERSGGLVSNFLSSIGLGSKEEEEGAPLETEAGEFESLDETPSLSTEDIQIDEDIHDRQDTEVGEKSLESVEIEGLDEIEDSSSSKINHNSPRGINDGSSDGEDLAGEEDMADEEGPDEGEVLADRDWGRESSGDPSLDEGDVKERLRELEEQIVDKESRELGKIQELEKRVERMEMEDETDLEERLARLENEVQSIKTPEMLDNRMTELENVVMNPERHIEKLLNNGLKQKLEEEEGEITGLKQEFDQEKKKLEAEIERIAEEQEKLERRIEEVKEEENSEEVEQELEELWEGLDEEVAALESEIRENSDSIEDLWSNIVELTEMLKKALNR